MTILVTGATSALGYFIAKRVREQYPQTEIKALSRSEKKSKELEELEISIVKGDLTNKNSLEKALKGIEIVYNVKLVITFLLNSIMMLMLMVQETY